jgi:hypothetical protein
MEYIPALVTASILSFNAATATVILGPITNPANGHIYYVTSPQTWDSALAEANSLGGNLVTIEDAAENSWITINLVGSSPKWIGLNDAATEGVFVWTDGTPSAYRNWESGEPNNAGSIEDSVTILSNGRWNDNWLAMSHSAIVEVVTEPGTTFLSLFASASFLVRRRR